MHSPQVSVSGFCIQTKGIPAVQGPQKDPLQIPMTTSATIPWCHGGGASFLKPGAGTVGQVHMGISSGVPPLLPYYVCSCGHPTSSSRKGQESASSLRLGK